MIHNQEAIEALRSKHDEHMRTSEEYRLKAILHGTALALLECHEATGISLDNWHPVREFVEHMSGHPLVENHV